MAHVQFPDSLRRHAGVAWTFSIPQQRNRSEFTRTAKVIGLPGAELWLASVTPRNAMTEAEVRKWRWFLAAVRGSENTFDLLALPTPQGVANKTVTAAVAGNRAVTVNSVAGLELGMHATVEQTNGHHRLVTIVGIQGLNVSFEPYLSSAPAIGSSFEVNDPYCRMTLSSGDQGWNDSGSAVSLSFDAEEALNP